LKKEKPLGRHYYQGQINHICLFSFFEVSLVDINRKQKPSADSVFLADVAFWYC